MHFLEIRSLNSIVHQSRPHQSRESSRRSSVKKMRAWIYWYSSACLSEDGKSVLNLALCPEPSKKAVVKPLIKKSNLDPEVLSNNYPRCRIFPTYPRSCRKQLLISCWHIWKETVCMPNFSRRIDEVITLRPPFFACKIICWQWTMEETMLFCLCWIVMPL